jgi:hypothetical protein
LSLIYLIIIYIVSLYLIVVIKLETRRTYFLSLLSDHIDNNFFYSLLKIKYSENQNTKSEKSIKKNYCRKTIMRNHCLDTKILTAKMNYVFYYKITTNKKDKYSFVHMHSPVNIFPLISSSLLMHFVEVDDTTSMLNKIMNTYISN